MNIFITRQFNQISDEGWPALQRKLKRLVVLLLELPLIFLSLLLVLLIRLIKPMVNVRIGRVDIGRIGGTYQGDWYLSEKAVGDHWGRHIDCFYFLVSTNHVNQQWKKMWKRALPLFPWAGLLRFVETVNQWFPGHKVHRIPDSDVMPTREEHVSYLTGRDPKVYSMYNKRLKAILGSNHPHLSFTTTEEARGKQELWQLGIPEGSSFICFHNRDSAYLYEMVKSFNWCYHDFRDSSIRNYLGAVEEMTGRGCYAVRLGAQVNEKVESANPKLIDYACNGMRSDFLDIYLSSKCRFILCSDTGMSFPAEIFKRPLVYVNWTNLLRVPVYVTNGLVIFKKFYLKNENRFMSFSEIMNFDFGGRNTNDIFAKLNLELQENTSEEIRAVTVEMDERLNGTWETTEEDEELQQRFWTLFGHDKLRSSNLRIGADFLRQNKDLLGDNLHLHLRCHNK